MILNERVSCRIVEQPRPRVVQRSVSGEEGYTVLEATVAVALLMTVLVPFSVTAMFLLTQRQSEDNVVALAVAQRYLEETVHAENYVSGDIQEDDIWRVRRDVEQRSGRVIVRIRVYRRADPMPYVELWTVRLL